MEGAATVILATALSAPPADPEQPREPAPGRRREITVPAWGFAAALFVLYAALSVRDQQEMLTGGFDLGIFDETVRQYAHGHLPYVSLKGTHFDELGDHFSPIFAVLAPVYWLFPTVYVLLLAQAALLAVGAVPLVGWAAREVGRRSAIAVGIAYGLSWGLASAVGFDVHEVAFAVPMLAFSATALGQRRWRAAAAWALPLLLVKEDLGVTLAAVGVYIALHGARRLGAATIATGLLGSYLEIKVLIPAFSSSGRYTYSGSITGGFGGGVTKLPHDFVHFITPETKIMTVLVMLAITGFLAVRSPITLLVVPTLTWRFVSTDPTYWGTLDQYSAVLMPIVFAGCVHGLIRLRADRSPLSTSISRTALIAGLACTLALLPDYPLWALTRSATWNTPSRVGVARSLMARIPDNVVVAAGNQLDAQLTDRDSVILLNQHTPTDNPAWVFIDTRDPDNFPLSGGQQAQVIQQLEKEGYRTVANEAGYLLLER
jgi:uncharacterized membrane protein